MRRKLVKQGQNALTVTLPAKWLKLNKLDAGDEVEIEEEKGRLVVAPESKHQELKQEILIQDTSSELISRVITNCYKQGIDELKLKFEKNAPINIIKAVVEKLTLGYEITDFGKDYCIIHDFSSEEKDKINIILRKCFLLNKEALGTILADIKNRKFNNREEIESLTDHTRKFVNYAIRINIKTLNDPNAIRHNILIFTNLHLFAIKLNYIYARLREENKVSNQTVEILEKLSVLFNLFYEAYYQKDLKIINEMLKMKQSLVKDIEANVEKKNGKIILQASMALRCVHDSIGALIGLITG